MKKFTGAGILFTAMKDDGMRWILLAKRRSGIWSIPGGGRSRHDDDPWDTAQRETIEEFGEPPDWGKEILVQRYPFGLIGFDWTPFVRELPEIPPLTTFPTPDARDFYREFTAAEWFPASQPPERVHILLRKVLQKLKFPKNNN